MQGKRVPVGDAANENRTDDGVRKSSAPINRRLKVLWGTSLYLLARRLLRKKGEVGASEQRHVATPLRSVYRGHVADAGPPDVVATRR